jgi:hypothetical protein
MLPRTRRDDRRRRRGELDRAAVEVILFDWPCLDGLVYVSGTECVGQLHMREAMMLRAGLAAILLIAIAGVGLAQDTRQKRGSNGIGPASGPARQESLNEAGDACGVGAG